MYKILLADDEAIVTDSVKYIIEHKITEECVIETAKTGRGVIEKAEYFQPDIAFVDIQMPGINGIDAMKEIRNNNSNIIFIVMTAYDKFDYAKEAVHLGVLEYLTKPVNQRRIVEVLHKAMSMVDERREKRSQDLRVKEKLEIVVPMIEQGFVASALLSDESFSEGENYKSLLGIKETHIFTLVLEFGENLSSKDTVNPIGTGVRLQRNYDNIRSQIKESYYCFVGPALGNKISCCVPTQMVQGDYESRAIDVEHCRELVRNLERISELSCRIGIGTIVPVEEMRYSVKDAEKALKSASGKVVHCRDLPIFCEYEEDYPVKLEEILFEKIKTGKVEDTKVAAEDFYDWLLYMSVDYEESVRLKTLEFVIFAESLALNNGGMVYRFGARKDYISIVSNANIESELRDWFVENMMTAAHNIATKKNEYSNDVIESAKEYIKAQYKKDLSLENISREMDMSPYYFSKLFKDVTGVNFIEYVTEVRISKAKELLLDGHATMKEICVEIGYSDPNYFSRIFKKCVGKTPTEFKEGA